MNDDRYHYPTDVFNLLVDTIPLLCKSKKDVMLMLEGSGIHSEDLSEMWLKVNTNRESVSKYEIVRDVLQKANRRGDSSLAARREVIKRVVEFEEFSTCWRDDIYKAKSNVIDLRKIVNAKDTFTRMKQERDRVQEEHINHIRRERDSRIARQKEIEEIRNRLNSLFGMDDQPQKRGKLLEGVLNDFFKIYGILVKEDFKRTNLTDNSVVEQIDGIIEFDNQIYLVEMKWLKTPVGVNELGQHMFRLYSRADARGIFISTSDYTSPAINECISHLNQKTMILATVKEFAMLLMHEGDLLEMLRKKVHAGLIEKNPFLEILSL
ncbi:MAG: restriction endonuclease [Undibacterium umbellatum]|uniref:restriction endonuclease n=1 Tax=Undibacterium umbellatum TaxID=2762300 RepID=UPI003BB6A6AE